MPTPVRRTQAIENRGPPAARPRRSAAARCGRRARRPSRPRPAPSCTTRHRRADPNRRSGRSRDARAARRAAPRDETARRRIDLSRRAGCSIFSATSRCEGQIAHAPHRTERALTERRQHFVVIAERPPQTRSLPSGASAAILHIAEQPVPTGAAPRPLERPQQRANGRDARSSGAARSARSSTVARIRADTRGEPSGRAVRRAQAAARP